MACTTRVSDVISSTGLVRGLRFRYGGKIWVAQYASPNGEGFLAAPCRGWPFHTCRPHSKYQLKNMVTVPFGVDVELIEFQTPHGQWI